LYFDESLVKSHEQALGLLPTAGDPAAASGGACVRLSPARAEKVPATKNR